MSARSYQRLTERAGGAAARAQLRGYLDRHGLRRGTLPEDVAAQQLHRWGVEFVQQHRVGRYRLDFAVTDVQSAIEIDGPHHLLPEGAHRDALRDAHLRSLGWLVLRVTAMDDDQLLRAILATRGLRG